MEPTVLEAPKKPRFSTAATDRAIVLQLIFGIIPAAISVLVLLPGVIASASGKEAWAFPVYCLAAICGLAGLVWAVIPSPRWAAWPILGLLSCGYAAVAFAVWFYSRRDPMILFAVLVVISPFVVGPLMVGAYQVTKVIRRLRHSQEDRSFAA